VSGGREGSGGLAILRVHPTAGESVAAVATSLDCTMTVRGYPGLHRPCPQRRSPVGPVRGARRARPGRDQSRSCPPGDGDLHEREDSVCELFGTVDHRDVPRAWEGHSARSYWSASRGGMSASRAPASSRARAGRLAAGRAASRAAAGRPVADGAERASRPSWGRFTLNSCENAASLFRWFDHSQRVADLPERGCPEPDEEGAPLGVATLVLVDCFRANPQADAQADRAERKRVEMRAVETEAIECVDDHDRAFPFSARVQSRRRAGKCRGPCRVVFLCGGAFRLPRFGLLGSR
jgi:hypothetical protein